MARIRTIKPEFWSDEKLAPLSPIERLTFLGLISMADDMGRVVFNHKIIDAFVFPETSDTCRDALATLSRIRRVVVGSTKSGQRILQIANWNVHQKVDKPNEKASLPEIVKEIDVTEIRDTLATNSRRSRDALATLTNDQRPTTDYLLPSFCSVSENVATEPDDPIFVTFPTNGNPRQWNCRESFIREMKEAYPNLDIRDEFRKALAWVKTNQRKTAKGMSKFLNSWLGRANDNGRSGTSQNQQGRSPARPETPRGKYSNERIGAITIQAGQSGGEDPSDS